MKANAQHLPLVRATVGPGGYTPGSGSFALKTGDGAQFGAVTPTAPVRFEACTAGAYDAATDRVTDRTRVTVYTATGRSFDTLTGVAFESSVSGSDQAYSSGDAVYVAATGADLTTIESNVATVAARVGLSVDDFGAAGNGTTDDTAALVAAFAAASAAGGGVVLLGPKTYALATTGNGLTFPARTTLRGVPGSTLLFNPSTSLGFAAAFAVAANDCRIEDVTFTRATAVSSVLVALGASARFRMRRCKLDGAGATITSVGCQGVKFGNDGGAATITDVAIDDCEFTGLGYGVFMSNESGATVTRFRVTNSHFHGNYADDLCFNAPTGGGGGTIRDVVVSGCHLHDNLSTNANGGFGIDLAHVVSAAVTGNTFETYRYEAVHVEDATGDVTVTGNTVVNCASVDNAPVHIINASVGLAVTGNVFDQTGVTASGTRTTQGCIYLGPGGAFANPGQVTISGNVFRLGTTWNGVDGFGESYVAVTGNLFAGGGAVSGGAYTGGTNWGVNFANGSVAVSGNTFTGLGAGVPARADTYPSPASRGTVSGNTFMNCSAGIDARPTGAVTIALNSFFNCVDSVLVGANGATSASSGALVALNFATGCTNHMGVGSGAARFWSSANGNNGPARVEMLNCEDNPRAGQTGFPILGISGPLT